MLRFLSILVVAGWLSMPATAAQSAKGLKYTDPEKADGDFAVQGEYVGTISTSSGDTQVGVQVIALGVGKFHAVAYLGGLPGDGWDGEDKLEADGKIKDRTATFEFEQATATIKDRVMTAMEFGGYELGKLKKVQRKSSTLGKKPPEDAIVLFDGTSADAFQGGRAKDGLLMQGATSKKTFGDHKLHIEFCLPYQPQDRGQARGNSGIYLQGRYEVQMLDSFGLEGKDNECGGIYTIKRPDINMCFPPLSWQTFDIEFTAAKYDAEGQLKSNPRMTVMHNGVTIHHDVELPSDTPTRAAPNKAGATAGPVFLQDHGCPVRYRNIWVVKK